MRSNHLILCGPLLLPPSVFPRIRVFSNEPALRIRWPKCWGFSFSNSPSNEYSGLISFRKSISFRVNWLDLLAVQGTLKSLLQHHSSKASILRCSAFFIVQLSHPFMTTGKTIALEKVDSCPNADSSTDDHGAKKGSFRGAEVEGGATCRYSAVSSDSRLSFLTFLFSIGVQLMNNVVTVSGEE